jgi:hypothetical protein
MGLDFEKEPLIQREKFRATGLALRTYVTLSLSQELSTQVFQPRTSSFREAVGQMAAPRDRMSVEQALTF